jgi:hypothetical protein
MLDDKNDDLHPLLPDVRFQVGTMDIVTLNDFDFDQPDPLHSIVYIYFTILYVQFEFHDIIPLLNVRISRSRLATFSWPPRQDTTSSKKTTGGQIKLLLRTTGLIFASN